MAVQSESTLGAYSIRALLAELQYDPSLYDDFSFDIYEWNGSSWDFLYDVYGYDGSATSPDNRVWYDFDGLKSDTYYFTVGWAKYDGIWYDITSEGDTLTDMKGLRVGTGAEKPLKYPTGGSWVQKTLRFIDGGEWR